MKRCERAFTAKAGSEDGCTAGSFDQMYDPNSIACLIEAWIRGIERV